MKRTTLFGMVVVLTTTIMTAPLQAGLVLTTEAHRVQSSSVAGVTTETFDSFTPGNYQTLTTAVGTLTSSSINIHVADQYGGAGGTGNYMAIGAESGSLSATLTLSSPQSYFGFWWSAADPYNRIEFLSNGVDVGDFNPTSALGSLNSSYLGNPNGGLDSSEKFAYLNVFGTNGTTFNQVIFSNLTSGTGFETDNWSILAAPVGPPYSGTVISNGITAAVPEPSSVALTAIGSFGMVGMVWRRRRVA